MVSINSFKQVALSFPEAVEEPHFEKISFRVAKKIFATLDVAKKQACIKLSETDQDVFSAFDKAIIFPVPNKWGKQGWTYLDLSKIPKNMCVEALKTAYREVAPKRLSVLLKTD